VLLGLPMAAATLLVAPAAAGATLPQQSPIDLRRATAVRRPELPPLQVEYPHEVDLRVRYVSRDLDDPAGCDTRGREETIEAEVPEGAAAVVLGGRRFALRQFHFHTPAEHTLDGRRPPLEQHFVHAGPDGETLVVGLLLHGGGHGGTAADRVLTDLPEECGDEIEVPGADLAAALPRDLTTFRYTGSLTTSPFTEPVAWNVLARRGRVASATLDGFRSLFPDGDARDTQPLNGRTVALRPQRPHGHH
jgi:carbonic anhydrase